MAPKNRHTGDGDRSTIYQHLIPSPDHRFSADDEGDLPNAPQTVPKSLYRIKKTSLLGTFAVLLYAAIATAVLVWSLGGDPLPSGGDQRVLRTSAALKVNQFYSGTAIAAVFTPGAILIRHLSHDFGRMHLFALAARGPVRVGDLDQMMDIGPLSLKTLWRYSKWTAGYQGLLMLTGALLVPVGSLMVTTGLYAPKTAGLAVVGMPVAFEGPQGMPAAWMGNLSASMGYDGTEPFVPNYDENDIFLEMVKTSTRGSIIDQTGIVQEVEAELGPISTGNITFQTGVQYNGIVTFKWDAGCENANDEISYTFGYTQGGSKYVNFTFPDGTKNSTMYMWGGIMPIGFLWSNATTKNARGFPIGGTTYLAIQSMLGDSMLTSLPSQFENPDMVFNNGTWISRVKCTPKLSWQVSSCNFDGRIMINCTKTDGNSAPALDTVGLNALEGYLTTILWSITLEADIPLGRALLSSSVSPSKHQMDVIFGLIAQSLVSVSTAGYFGTVTVKTMGEPLRHVYITRMYPLILGVVLLTLVATMSLMHIILSRLQHSPFRRTTFLTIAHAVRGSWWDRELRGGSVLDEALLAEKHSAEVMFGVDAENLGSVRLAPNIYRSNKFTKLQVK
ncbi:hypothetical protein P154DRAFT_566303 [Amniculicola lignicola CBS 123094]|uniref:Uncharacterized protein n=1 Tax=Amniculicola lignicola CBS 123094 TaxID=1392246 RepID=A0A6A5W5N2_9PLEO|nr:hypothetical protein P154DRAFT_566303 [Amniculicola lignicola CBS 123094]